MIPFYEDLYTFLTNSEAVSALVGEQIHPGKLPQDPDLPAIVTNRITLDKVRSHDGDSHLGVHPYQLKCYALTYREANQIADVLEGLMEGYAGVFGSRELGASFVFGRRDDVDPVTDLKVEILEIRFHERG